MFIDFAKSSLAVVADNATGEVCQDRSQGDPACTKVEEAKMLDYVGDSTRITGIQSHRIDFSG